MRSATNLAFIDVETNGLGSDARIIEIAVIGVDAETGVTSTFTSLVRGDGRAGPDWVHGIKDDDLQSAPLFEEIWPEVSLLIHGRVIVTHNEVFDRRIVNYELKRIGESELSKFLCTKTMASRLGYAKRKSGANEGTSAKLSDLAIRLGLAMQPVHRALADAQTCRGLFDYFAERHPSDVANALGELATVHSKNEISKLLTDHRKPAIIIVDSANINERRRGRQWEFTKDGKEFQFWSYEHFFDFHKNLNLHIPGAVILCFFDEQSSERCATAYDNSGLIYSFSRLPHDAFKIFKVPNPFKADDVIVALAKELGAFVISGDHFVEQDDTENWHKSEMQFYAQFPVDTQNWRFINKKDVALVSPEKRTLLDVAKKLDLRDVTSGEGEKIAKYAEAFAEKFYKDLENTPRRLWLKRRFSKPHLSNQIVIGNIQLNEIPVRSRKSEVLARAYQIPLLRKYLKKHVTVVGRLTVENSIFYLEWFKSYKPIQVIPDDTTTFLERIQSRQFVEVSGELTESSGVLILKAARIEKVLEFTDLVRRNSEQTPRVVSYAKIGRFTDPRAGQMIRQISPALPRQTILLQDVPLIKKSALVLDDILDLDLGLPNPPNRRFGRRQVFAVSLTLIFGWVLFFFFGDAFQAMFNFLEAPTNQLGGGSGIHLTYR